MTEGAPDTGAESLPMHPEAADLRPGLEAPTAATCAPTAPSTRRASVYSQLERTTLEIANGVQAIAHAAGIPMTTNHVGSMFTWFFTAEKVDDFESAAKSDTAAFGRFHRAMMEAGVWLPPSQFEAAFLSTAHGEREVELLLDAAKRAFL